MTEGPRPTVSPLRAGLAGRCPNCGSGPMFRGFLAVADRCEVCGEDLGAHEQGDGPAVFVILILGLLVVAAALLVEIRFTPPLWLHALVWPPVIVLGALALLRPLKGILVALHFRHRKGDVERG